MQKGKNKKDIFISKSETIKSALKKLNETAKKVLLVVDRDKKLEGTVTDGDIRRAILMGKSLENSIQEIYNKKPVFMRKNKFSLDSARELFIKNKVELLPVLNEKRQVVDYATWSELFSESKEGQFLSEKINVPVVVMAGGKGERLDPYTRILPKPLIPIGDKPVLEIVIEEFKKQGAETFYLTLNYKAEMIEAYLNSIKKNYTLHYIKEKDFLGTAGSLKLVEKKIADNFIVSNCDVIVKADYAEAIRHHKERKAALTILAPIQHYKIPHGVIKFKNGGEVESIVEKPEYTMTINAGVYIFSKEALQFIPGRTRFDMNDFINKLIKKNKKVVIYPVNESSYIDIGEWEEYKKSMEKLQSLH